MQKQVDARAAEQKRSNEQAKKTPLAEKQPSMKFVTTDPRGALAMFLCSDGAARIRGATYDVGGGWSAQ